MSGAAASILLVAYNHEAFIEAALLSALRQDIPDYELIVVDDASTDRTREVIRRVLEREAVPGRRVTTIFHERNQGLLAAINAAMASASGEIFMMMAGDDVSMPDRLRRTLRIFGENRTVMLVYGAVEVIDDLGRPLHPVPASGSVRRITYRRGPWGRIYAGAMPCGASAAYRRVLFDVFGPMGPGTHAEDNCYWVRALLLGEIHHDPVRFIQWRQHAANLSNYRMATTEDWRHRHLSSMAKHAEMSGQWLADVARARDAGLISAWRAAAVRYAARREDATWGLEVSSLRADPWGSWFSAACRLLSVGRVSTVLRMFRLRASAARREKRWAFFEKLKSNGPV